MKRIWIILIITVCVFLTGCGNSVAYKLFKLAGDKEVYIIEQKSMFADEWDEVIIVFGYHDDYGVGKRIAKYLSETGRECRVVKLKD